MDSGYGLLGGKESWRPRPILDMRFSNSWETSCAIGLACLEISKPIVPGEMDQYVAIWSDDCPDAVWREKSWFISGGWPPFMEERRLP